MATVLRRAPSLPAFLRVPRGVGPVGRCPCRDVQARPPIPPSSAVTADGATRAARRGAFLCRGWRLLPGRRLLWTVQLPRPLSRHGRGTWTPPPLQGRPLQQTFWARRYALLTCRDFTCGRKGGDLYSVARDNRTVGRKSHPGVPQDSRTVGRNLQVVPRDSRTVERNTREVPRKLCALSCPKPSGKPL